MFAAFLEHLHVAFTASLHTVLIIMALACC